MPKLILRTLALLLVQSLALNDHYVTLQPVAPLSQVSSFRTQALQAPLVIMSPPPIGQLDIPLSSKLCRWATYSLAASVAIAWGLSSPPAARAAVATRSHQAQSLPSEARRAALEALTVRGDFQPTLNLFIESYRNEEKVEENDLYQALAQSAKPSILPSLKALINDDSRHVLVRAELARLANHVVRSAADPRQAARALGLTPEAEHFFDEKGWLILRGNAEAFKKLADEWDVLEILLNQIPERTILWFPVGAIRRDVNGAAFNLYGVIGLPVDSSLIPEETAHEPVHFLYPRLPLPTRQRLEQAHARAPRAWTDFSITLGDTSIPEQAMGDHFAVYIYRPEVLFMLKEVEASPSLTVFTEVAANSFFSFRRNSQRYLRLYWPRNLPTPRTGRYSDVPVPDRDVTFGEIVKLYRKHWPYPARSSLKISPEEKLAQDFLNYLTGKKDRRPKFPYLRFNVTMDLSKYSFRKEYDRLLAPLEAASPFRPRDLTVADRAILLITERIRWRQFAFDRRDDYQDHWRALWSEQIRPNGGSTYFGDFYDCLRYAWAPKWTPNFAERPWLEKGLPFMRDLLQKSGVARQLEKLKAQELKNQKEKEKTSSSRSIRTSA